MYFHTMSEYFQHCFEFHCCPVMCSVTAVVLNDLSTSGIVYTANNALRFHIPLHIN